MKFSVFNRKTHYWASAAVAAPLIVIIASGILLQVKKEVAWVQPPEKRGGKEPALDYPRILEICRGIPEARVAGWADIRRIDTRPSRGLTKVTTVHDWEIQLDAETGAVLQSSYRRSDIIESLHDGSWFHPAVKYGIFLPAGLTLLFLWLSGVYMFIHPFWVKWRRRPARFS